jgi:predicted PurR-regulated permease PerM
MATETRTGDNRKQSFSREAPASAPGALAGGSRLNGPGMTAFALRVVVVVLISVLILTIALVLWYGIHVLLEAFAGLLFAVFLSALANWLSQHTKLSYRWSLVVVLVVLFLVLSGVGWLLANRLASQISELSQKLPESLHHIRDYLSQYAWVMLLLERVPQSASSLTEGGSSRR